MCYSAVADLFLNVLHSYCSCLNIGIDGLPSDEGIKNI